MTNSTTLGRLERVELREIWSSEAADFTPWLARSENLGILADTLGMDLEPVGVEQRVGPFRADLLCRDPRDESYVLIENQLESTNHRHLGQILTYAAGLKAATIVWIAQEFTSEHRAALDWLNAITPEHYSFLGLEIELWRIGDSAIAPKFNVVCQPNNWERIVSPDVPSGSRRELQFQYWSSLFDKLKQSSPPYTIPKPVADSSVWIRIGSTKFAIAIALNSFKQVAEVMLICRGKRFAKHTFGMLNADRAAIESQLGFGLDWREMPEKIESRIVAARPNTDYWQREQWPQQHLWIEQHVQKMYEIFRPRIGRILEQLGDQGDDVSEEEANEFEPA